MVSETSGAGSAGGRGEWDREEGEEAFFWKKLLFLLFILKSYPEHLQIALVLEVLVFSPIYN